MHETSSIASQPLTSSAVQEDKAGHLPQYHDQEPELNEKLPIQLKLSVGAVNDPLEHEADAMADKVMRMPETSFIQRRAAAHDPGDYDDEHVRLKPLANQVTPFIHTKGDGGRMASNSVSNKIKASKGSGNPMPESTKSFMENRFGTDFSSVKIHTGDEPAQLNRKLSSKAFTVSNDIYFNDGQYQPETDSGKFLLAHELTHTIQQTGSTPGIQKFDSPEHVEAGNAGGQATSGFIVLDSHNRDLPNRLNPVAQWSANMRTLFNNGSTQQKRFLQSGLSYGEIVALSGDFYETFEHLNTAPLRELYDLLPLISGPATTEQLQAVTGGRYMALAERNDAHFSRARPGHANNIQTWRQRHIEAIMVAKQGNSNLAFAINAAADHFLTDRFAAGHLLTPRTDFSATGGVTALTHHDIDNQNGVVVSNLRHNVWVSYGDEMWSTPQNTDNRRYTIEAVTASVQDISNALSQRNAYPAITESTVFAAEQIVPQIDTATQVVEHTSVRMRGGLRHRAAGLPGVVGERVWTSDDLVRDWVNRMDNSAIRAQPAVEQIRMVDTLLTGVISTEDADVIVRICQNAVPGAAAQIRQLLQPYYTHRDFGIRMRIRIAIDALPR